MEAHGVVPDVIGEVPLGVLEVTYSGNLTVNMGTIVTPTQVKDAPAVNWKIKTILEMISHFTLIMTDPDSPSRVDPKYREWHHWLVVNIPADDLKSGQVLSHYIGAGPPEGTDLHRYVFLLYKQPKRIKFEEPVLLNNSGKNRAYFKSRLFAEKYKLGVPIAGNFFRAKFDNYVPELYRQISGS